MTDFHPDRARTHRVFNQPPLLEDYSLFEHDAILRECLSAHGGDFAGRVDSELILSRATPIV